MARRRIPTKKELLQLQQMYRTDKRIAQALGGVPEHLVAYWRRKKGIGRSTFPKYSYPEIRELWERYGDDYKAGQQLGITKQAFYRWRKQYKLMERPAILKLEQLELKFYDEHRLSRGGDKQPPAQTVLQKIAAFHNSQPFINILETVSLTANLYVDIDSRGVRARSFGGPGQNRRRRKPAWERYDSVLDLIESGYFIPGQVVLSARREAVALTATASYVQVNPEMEVPEGEDAPEVEFTALPSLKFVLRGSATLRLSPYDIACQIAEHLKDVVDENYLLELSGVVIERLTLEERVALLSYLSLFVGNDVFLEPDQTFLTQLQRLGPAKVPVPFSDKNSHNLDSRELLLAREKPAIFSLTANSRLTSFSGLARKSLRRIRVGPLVGGTLDNIKALATTLKGTTIESGLEVIVIPASRKIFADAARRRFIQHLVDAGVRIGNTCFQPTLPPLAASEFEMTTEVDSASGLSLLASINVISQAIRAGKLTKRLFESG
jgi:transposase-like protein